MVVASGARYRRPAIPETRPLRGPRRLVLGVADRGAALRRRGGRPGRRRQFGGSGGGLPLRPCREGAHDGARPGPRRKHVALSDRPHRRGAEHRTDDRDGDRRAAAARPDGARARPLARPSRTGEETEAPIRNVFLFVGADPATDWLRGAASRSTRPASSSPASERPTALRCIAAESSRRRVRGRRRALGLGQARRRRDRRRRAGRAGAPRLSCRTPSSAVL